MSGVEVPRLGSYRDKVLRGFMEYEVQRSLKREQLNLAMALMSCSNDDSRELVKDIWTQLLELEFGIKTPVDKGRSDKDAQMIAEYERMKQKNVILSYSNKGGLTVSGL